MWRAGIILVAFFAVSSQADCNSRLLSVAKGGAECVTGKVLASDAAFTECPTQICNLLDDWEIAHGLNKQMGGQGYTCSITNADAGTADRICEAGSGPGPSPGGSSSSSSGMSGGAVFIIIFFCGFAVYFAAGAVFMWKVKGATGIEIVPNVAFWKDLPALMKDGAMFLKNKFGGGYQSI